VSDPVVDSASQSAPGPHPHDELTELAVALAVGAGRRARRWRRDGFAIDVKSTPTDLVTEVDRAVEQWIVDELTARRPGDGIVGEEGASIGDTTGMRWLVDPIDGTVNFALGLRHYAVSVAVQVDGQIVGGCVHNPESGEIYHAQLGCGAYLSSDPDGRSTIREVLSGGLPLRGPRPISLDRAVVGTGFAYDAGRRAKQGAVLAALVPRIADIRRMGAASLDLCAVAAGRLDGYFEAGLNPWDWAAGMLIATEAGCVSSGLRSRGAGDAFTAVASPSLAPEFFALLQDLDADLV
jgi:myo-inositol-1(or 4)-monophosphatase